MLKLYTAKGTIGLACELALAESGLDYEVRRLNFADNEQRQAAYLAVNPKSRVPALETPRGVITETPAILAYIGRTAGSLPAGDAYDLAQAEALMGYLSSWVHPAAAHRWRGYRWADDPAAIAEMHRKAPEVFGEAMHLVDETLFRGPWALGEDFSVCDPYVYVLTSWLPRDTLDMADFPRLADHFERMTARPATKAVLAAVEAG